MKRSITIFWVLLSTLCYAQMHESSKHEPTDRIIFTYSQGHASWEPGIYSRDEKYEFVRSELGFEIQSAVQYKKRKENDDSTHISESVSIQLNSRKVSATTIASLMTELSHSKNNFDEHSIKAWLPKLSLRSIRKKLTGLLKADPYKEYSWDEDDVKDLTREIHRYKGFDDFIEEIKPDTNIISSNTDAWNVLHIRMLSQKDTVEYRLSFFGMPLGQPILKIVNDEIKSRIVNLSVNEALFQVIPKNTMLSKQLSNETLLDEFIQWKLRKNFE